MIVSSDTDPLAPHRRRLMGLAYRMLGSLSDAEDILQDAYIRFAKVDRDDIKSEEAYLVTLVTRLCLDRLKSAKARREIYVGPWLPEPAPDAEALSPQSALELADDLSFALLLTLERLSAPERAAFILHDVFDSSYADVAAALDKSEAACRQLAARARKAVRNDHLRRDIDEGAHQTLLQGFVQALATGDANMIEPLLAGDAIAYSDGGGVKVAALNPIYGSAKVAKFFAGLTRKAIAGGQVVAPVFAAINGEPGILIYVEGALDNAITVDVRDRKIEAIYVVRNPEKLAAFPALILH